MKTILMPNHQINPCPTIQFDQIDYTKPIGFIENGHKGFLVKRIWNSKGSSVEFSLRAKRDFGNGNGWLGNEFESLKYIMDSFYNKRFEVQFFQFDSDQEFFEWLAKD